MGIYAQTNYEINTKDLAIAKKVEAIIVALSKNDKDGNTYGDNVTVGKDGVSAFMDSGRIQNLEYKCGQIWEAIKNIKGVLEFSCPFMSEADGYYQSNN